MKTLALATAAVGLAFTATPALAGSDYPSVTVSTEGLDLSTVKGQELLERRINRAARQVCQLDEAVTGTRIQSHQARECVAKARAGVEQQVATLIQDQQRGG